MKCYFFRNCINYEELENKTDKAYKRNSRNLREVKIVKRIEIEKEHENLVFNYLLTSNQYIIDNLANMKIENGVWQCIELYCKENDGKSILVMSDGYPYAKFTAVIQKKRG